MSDEAPADDGLPDPLVSSRLTTWLHWDGTQGHATHEGVSINLKYPPKLPGIPLVRMLYYAPQTHAAWIRVSGQSYRPMTAAEMAHAQAWLEGMVDRMSPFTQPGDLGP